MEDIKEHSPLSDSLLPRVRRVLIGRIAVHSIVGDVARLRNGITPKRLRLNSEIFDNTPSDVTERERNRASIAILARTVRKVRPPGLSVPVDSSCGVGVDHEVVACDDKPGGLVLDEDNAVRVIRVQPVIDIRLELKDNQDSTWTEVKQFGYA